MDTLAPLNRKETQDTPPHPFKKKIKLMYVCINKSCHIFFFKSQIFLSFISKHLCSSIEAFCSYGVPNLVSPNKWFIYILAFLHPKVIKRVTCSHVRTNIRTDTRAHTQSCIEKQTERSETSCHADRESSYFWDFVWSPLNGDILPSWGTGELTGIWW